MRIFKRDNVVKSTDSDYKAEKYLKNGYEEVAKPAEPVESTESTEPPKTEVTEPVEKTDSKASKKGGKKAN